MYFPKWWTKKHSDEFIEFLEGEIKDVYNRYPRPSPGILSMVGDINKLITILSENIK